MGHDPGQLAVDDYALSRDNMISDAASQSHPLSDSVIFLLSLRQNFCYFQQGKFCLQMFLALSDFSTRNWCSFFLFRSNNHLSQFPEWKLLPPISRHGRKERAKTENSLLFINVWLSLYPFWKSAVLRMLTILLDILPMDINVSLFF